MAAVYIKGCITTGVGPVIFLQLVKVNSTTQLTNGSHYVYINEYPIKLFCGQQNIPFRVMIMITVKAIVIFSN